jgi:F-type H+-transporting ATPase subunit delta
MEHIKNKAEIHINPGVSNIARPYALAAFEYAREKQQLPEWISYLGLAAVIARHASVVHLLGNPEISGSAWVSLFHDVLKNLLNTEREHFLLLLAQNKRLVILPEIAELFNRYYAALEKTSHIRVVTAVTLDEDMKKTLGEALTKRTNRKITLQCDIDTQLIGGAVIHIDDRVIDGSIRGKLTRLLEFSLR